MAVNEVWKTAPVFDRINTTGIIRGSISAELYFPAPDKARTRYAETGV